VKPRLLTGLAVTAVVVLAVAIRLRLLDVPLDRDEGEFAYFGQLLLAGVPPYAEAYNLKMPGIYGAYALIMAVFGQTPSAIRAGLILTTSATTVAAYLFGARLGGLAVGVTAAGVFAALSLSPRMLGIAAYAEHFALLPVVVGALTLWSPARERLPMRVFASGLLFGIGVLVRQSTVVFVAGGVVYLLLAGREQPERSHLGRVGAIAVFLGGAAAPLALTAIALCVAGTFKTFWFWVFAYARYYQADPATGWSNLVRTLGSVAPSTSLALALAAIGLGSAMRDPTRDRRLFVLVFAASSVLGTAMGLQFRPHYFLLAVPALALLSGMGLVALSRLLAGPPGSLRSAVPVLLGLVAIIQPLYASRTVLFELAPAQVSRAIYGRNPFPESVEVARYIREHSDTSDRIAVVGSEPQIYFYSGRRAATGYIYTYPLMELQPYAAMMQRNMIQEIEAAAPRYLVFVSATRSWIARPDSDRTIFGWFESYQRGFTRVGVVDILPQQETVYRWGEAAADYVPRSDVWLMVFARPRPS
jgi:hypothetical protein